MNRLTEPFRRAMSIYETEGLMPLARQAAAFAAGRVFRYETYYLYENDGSSFSKRGDVGLPPGVDGLAFRVVHTNEEADALEAEGLRFRKYAGDARGRLDKGAMAFCVFVGHDLASIGWLCTTQRAKDSLNEPPPAKVDFSKKEAWAGGSWTNARYRRMGLYRYTSLKMVEYWLQQGIVKDKWAVDGRNVASLAAESKTGNVRYAEGRLVRVLWWKHWWEKPLTAREQERDAEKAGR
ncbi:MAG: hypothetical protein SVP26_05555 [Chloroflexota bacterium]|nr:hypothetical protein [Chloroflexota bacterium]